MKTSQIEPIFVVDRLLPRGQVDDAQPPHPEADARLDVDPLVVGPAMPDDVAHPVHEAEFGVVARMRKGLSPGHGQRIQLFRTSDRLFTIEHQKGVGRSHMSYARVGPATRCRSACRVSRPASTGDRHPEG